MAAILEGFKDTVSKLDSLILTLETQLGVTKTESPLAQLYLTHG